ncbi:MAG: hypothetical protein LAQ30_11440 [Acidobacteriia bacterium]|nr:hypothetical protein [Terriglobia bacterium]
MRYAANTGVGESYINIVNDGANGAPLLGPGLGDPTGNICVNVFAFAPDQQLMSCCSCLVTPNALVNLGVTRDLLSNPLTPVTPVSVVVKLVATLAGPGGGGISCTNSAALVATATKVPGMLAWGTSNHSPPNGSVGYQMTETAFTPAILSQGELDSMAYRCGFMIGNGGGYGICRSCRAGALGAARR